MQVKENFWLFVYIKDAWGFFFRSKRLAEKSRPEFDFGKHENQTLAWIFQFYLLEIPPAVSGEHGFLCSELVPGAVVYH